MTRALVLIALGLSMPLMAVQDARADECGDAVHKYQSAENALSSALAVYGDCIADSRGRDECSNEFSHLDSANENFSFAVSNYKDELPLGRRADASSGPRVGRGAHEGDRIGSCCFEANHPACSLSVN